MKLTAAKESSFTHGASVSSFVNHALSFLGVHNAQQMSLAVQQQINMQVANHNIAGTLVISISCTHRNASIFAPLIIDVDKALKAWNFLYPNDRISTSSLALLLEDIRKEVAPDARTFSILSGATFGSSLVGMVHILNDTSTISVDSMTSLASQIQEKMNVGAWMSSMNGEFGVASSFATIVRAWVNHYYPNEYNKAGGIDDSQSDSEESSEE